MPARIKWSGRIGIGDRTMPTARGRTVCGKKREARAVRTSRFT